MAKSTLFKMSNKVFIRLLRKARACDESVEWIGDRSFKQAFDECESTSWMFWLLGKMEGQPGWLTRQQIVLLACDCAETALKYVKTGEDRPRLAIEIARKWANGDTSISLDDVRAAARNSRAAYAAAAAYAADAAAAAYAADAAAYAAAAAVAAAAAAYAADAYAADAYAAAYAAARSKARKQMCDLIRAKFLEWTETSAN